MACQHYYIYPTVDDRIVVPPTAVGVCQKCGTTREDWNVLCEETLRPKTENTVFFPHVMRKVGLPVPS